MPNFAITPTSLHRLRHRLEALAPGAAAEILQDAGFVTGEALAQRWRNRVAERTGLLDAGALDARWFGPLLDELCVQLGWGSLTVVPLGDAAVLLEAGAWAEAEPGATRHPGCHFSSGVLAAFLTAEAGAPIGVLEVECRSTGAEACRFVAGSAETLGGVYDLIAAGGDWRAALPTER